MEVKVELWSRVTGNRSDKALAKLPSTSRWVCPSEQLRVVFRIDMAQPSSKLQQLELAHAGEDTLEDIRRAEALSTDTNQVTKGYFTSLPLIGAIASISLSTV
jgi:hypothetical protein